MTATSDRLLSERTFLFLQGPLSTFFSEIAASVVRRGGQVLRINFCGNDVVDWKHKGATHFRGKPEHWETFLREFLEKQSVTDIVLHGDRRFYHRVAVGLADKRDINVVATELGYLRPDWMTVERGGCSVKSHFPNDPETISDIAAKLPEPVMKTMYPGDPMRQVIQELQFTAVNALFRPWFPHYCNHRQESRAAVYGGWLKARLSQKYRTRRAARTIGVLRQSATPYYLVAMQLDGDFQIRDHSPFNGMADAIDYIARSFSEHAPQDRTLVFKTHPLEYRHRSLATAIITAAKRYGLKDRIVRVDGGDLHDLAARSQGFVTVNSSAGLEALSAGCPTYSIMPTIYDVAGLTFQGSLNDFWKKGGRPDSRLQEDLKRALAGTIQVRGTIYNTAGLVAAADAVAERLVSDSVNAPGAFVPVPPRLEKAARMGVSYDH